MNLSKWWNGLLHHFPYWSILELYDHTYDSCSILFLFLEAFWSYMTKLMTVVAFSFCFWNKGRLLPIFSHLFNFCYCHDHVDLPLEVIEINCDWHLAMLKHLLTLLHANGLPSSQVRVLCDVVPLNNSLTKVSIKSRAFIWLVPEASYGTNNSRSLIA